MRVCGAAPLSDFRLKRWVSLICLSTLFIFWAFVSVEGRECGPADRVRRSKICPQISHWFPVWSWTSHWTSLCVSIPFCNMSMVFTLTFVKHFQICWWVQFKIRHTILTHIVDVFIAQCAWIEVGVGTVYVAVACDFFYNCFVWCCAVWIPLNCT